MPGWPAIGVPRGVSLASLPGRAGLCPGTPAHVPRSRRPRSAAPRRPAGIAEQRPISSRRALRHKHVVLARRDALKRLHRPQTRPHPPAPAYPPLWAHRAGVLESPSNISHQIRVPERAGSVGPDSAAALARDGAGALGRAWGRSRFRRRPRIAAVGQPSSSPATESILARSCSNCSARLSRIESTASTYSASAGAAPGILSLSWGWST